MAVYGARHLVQWDAGDAECLLQLVKELIQQYRQYQCQRLRESSRLLFEYDSLLKDPNYCRSMEIYTGHKNSWAGEFSARFLLKLPVDFSDIPIYLLKDTLLDPGEDVALLSVSFEDTEATQVFFKLYLSPSIEQCSISFKATTRGESTLLPFSVTLEWGWWSMMQRDSPSSLLSSCGKTSFSLSMWTFLCTSHGTSPP
ncbi:BRISC and BRCA1-A complex member 2-like [Salvelinus alpinus]